MPDVIVYIDGGLRPPPTPRGSCANLPTEHGSLNSDGVWSAPAFSSTPSSAVFSILGGMHHEALHDARRHMYDGLHAGRDGRGATASPGRHLGTLHGRCADRARR